MISTLLQIAGIVLIALYFSVESMASKFVLIAGIALAIVGFIGRSMTKAR